MDDCSNGTGWKPSSARLRKTNLSSLAARLFPFFSWLTPFGMPFPYQQCNQSSNHNKTHRFNIASCSNLSRPYHALFPLYCCSSNFCCSIIIGISESLCKFRIFKIRVWVKVLQIIKTNQFNLVISLVKPQCKIHTPMQNQRNKRINFQYLFTKTKHSKRNKLTNVIE